MGVHLPVLIVVVPLLGALLTPFMGRGKGPWLFATLTTWCVFAMTIALYIQVDNLSQRLGIQGAIVSYTMGNWKVPWGIEYRVDLLNSFILLIIAMISAVVTVYARLSVAHDIPNDRTHILYSLWLLFITGLLGVAITGDVFNVYVLVEISSLSYRPITSRFPDDLSRGSEINGHPAVFLDRDGVINDDVGYLKKISQLSF